MATHKEQKPQFVFEISCVLRLEVLRVLFITYDLIGFCQQITEE